MPYDSPWDGYAGGNRQPNFLQKLYDFLAIEPHPCPEVIYWAADSRQLVIAQPDRLAKEVLPRLFKHDKMSSFGRQLNIYGFARVFPGRQFKDAQGRVLDASVWAHPSLHRLSTTSEIASVKRRAAPKLFRTRRLANGQLVRSKAGPEVEKRFREVKEGLAGERRARGQSNWTSAGASLGAMAGYSRTEVEAASPPDVLEDYAGDWPNVDSRIQYSQTPYSAYLTQDDYPHPTTHNSSGSYAPTSAPAHLSQFDTGRLASISEGIENYDVSPPFWQTQHHLHAQADPKSPSNHKPDANDYLSPGASNLAGITRHHETIVQSCPASIHASPVLGHSSLAAGWSNLFNHTPRDPHPYGSHRESIDSFTSHFSSPTDYSAGMPQATAPRAYHRAPGLKIATPAAPNPFSWDSSGSSNYNFNPSFLPQRSTYTPAHAHTHIPEAHNYAPQALQLVGASPTDMVPPSSISSAFSTASLPNSAFPARPSLDFGLPASASMPPPPTPTFAPTPNYERRDTVETIDPRWISPLSSLWSTPTSTPLRGRSPTVRHIPGFQDIGRTLELGDQETEEEARRAADEHATRHSISGCSTSTALRADSPEGRTHQTQTQSHEQLQAHLAADTPHNRLHQDEVHQHAEEPLQPLHSGSVALGLKWATLEPFRRQSDITGVTPVLPIVDGGTQSYPPRGERKGFLGPTRLAS